MDSPPIRAAGTTASATYGSGRGVLAKRAVSTVGLWLLVIGVFVWGNPYGFAFLIGGLAVLGTWEFHLTARHAGLLSTMRLGVLGALAYSVWLYVLLISGREAGTHVLDTAAFALFLGAGFCVRLLRPVDGERSVIGLAVAMLGFVYLAFGMNFMGRVVFHGYTGTGVPPGAWLALWLAAVTKFTDMGAYLVGSMIGRHKMIPHISPGKTWEGLIGAFGFSQAAACGLYAAFPGQLAALGGWPQVVGLGLVLAVAAIIGDLAESLVKRSLAIKDSGHSLPGIGGVMDLIDSLCFTAPILYFYLHWQGAASGL